MDLSILELFLNASIVVQSVIVILILASIVSWMIIFERWIYIKKVNQEFFDFETRFWSDSGLEALLLTLLVLLHDKSLRGNKNRLFT